MKSNIGISVVVPVFNEQENLWPLTERLRQSLNPLEIPFEIIFVDDGSIDSSREKIFQIANRYQFVKAIFFHVNHGQSAAFEAGFQSSSGELIVSLDADLQNDPSDIPRMIEIFRESRLDVLCGWRKGRQEDLFLRKIPSVIANWIIRKVTGVRVHDLGCSLRVYRKEIAQNLVLYGEMHRFICVLAASAGAKIGEVEIQHHPRKFGKSKYGISRAGKVLIDLLSVLFFSKFKSKPGHFFGGIGLLFFFVSLVFVSSGAWGHGGPSSGFSPNSLFLIGVAAFFSGVHFLGLGLVAEMLLRVYFESQNKSPYTILQKIGFDKIEPKTSKPRSFDQFGK